jgi:hypothetical protein
LFIFPENKKYYEYSKKIQNTKKIFSDILSDILSEFQATSIKIATIDISKILVLQFYIFR